METILPALRAAAEPTRLRLLALCGAAQLCVSDLVEVLGQSQPRLSRHLKLLTEAGLLERAPEGPHVYFRLPAAGPGAALARALLAQLPQADATLAADRRRAAQVAADRARAASDAFRRDGIDWEEARALGLPSAAIERALLAALPRGGLGRVLDIGTGTGRLLELLAPRAGSVMGVDASPKMLALARARISERGLANCAVRQADMYRLPFADAAFDLVAMAMVLHYADDVPAALAEAARVLAPGGRLLLLDLGAHDRTDLAAAQAHRHAGFSEAALVRSLATLGLAARAKVVSQRPLPVLLCSATAPAPAAARRPELAVPA